METIVRPSADLRNHYNEISQECHEKRTPIIITKMEKVIRLLWGYKTIIRCSQNWNYCVPWQKRRKMLSMGELHQSNRLLMTYAIAC